MIDVVINYDEVKDEFKIYESSTDTILISKNLTEALISLSSFLNKNNLIKSDLLNSNDIIYHLDSGTIKKMIESNVNLMKKLNNAPSGFTISSQKFGGSKNLSSSIRDNKESNNSFGNHGKLGKIGSFSGKSAFKASNRKFGNKGKNM